jgi:hypothetical protein
MIIRLHEILKIVSDLQERGELELAQRIAGQYMDRLDSGELRFNYLTITAKLGRYEQVMDAGSLPGYDRWFRPGFATRLN